MPRPRNTASSPLSHGQASYVLDRLIRERRVSSGDVSRYLDEMRQEISDLEERLNRLREAHGGASSSGAGAGASSSQGGGAAVPAPRGRRPGRPAGRPGRPPGRPAGSGRGPGRPPRSASAGAGASGANAGGGAAAGGAAKGGARGARKRSAITPEQLASRQLQGRYLALVRQFPENKRAQYAKTAKEKGREAAIREMQDSLKK